MKFLIPIIILLALYLAMICPNISRKRRARMKPFEETYVAHRGFFDNASDAPENSLAAFRRAVERGFAVELDIQLTADGQLVVFHDTTLERMCGVDLVVHECTYEELLQYRLANSDEKIPLYTEVLEVIDEKVPMIVEIKANYKPIDIARRLADIMDHYKGVGYHGIYCMESFRPIALAWYRKHHPEVIRGQLATDVFRDKEGKRQHLIVKIVGTNMLCNFLARPDFIAYNHKYKYQLSFQICRLFFPAVRVAWTIKSKAELLRAKKYFQVFIFDSFDPLKNRGKAAAGK